MPLTYGPRPSRQEIIEWRDLLCQEWKGDEDGGSGLLTQQDDEEKVYFQQFPMETPGGRLAVRTGSAPSDCDAAIDSLTPADIMVKVKPVRSRDKYKQQAEKLGRYARALLQAWQKKKPILRLLASDMVIRRFAVARVMYDDTIWSPTTAPDGLDGDALDDWAATHRRKCPIILQRRDPMYVRWREVEGEILVVVEDYRVQKLELLQTLGHYKKARDILQGREVAEFVRFSDVWVGGYRCLLIEDQPIFPSKDGVMPHLYPKIPYVFMPFRELPFHDPAKRYRGMLSNSSGLYRIESQVLSMVVWMLAWNAWRTYIGWTRDNRKIEIIPGQMVPIDKRIGEYLEILEGKPFPPELVQVAGVVDSYIQRNGVAQGPRTAEGTRSAQQLWAIQAMRQLKIDAPKESMKRGLENSLSLATEIHETMVKEPITLPVSGKERDKDTGEIRDLGEVTVRPQDINGYYDGYSVSFSRRLDPALIEQAKSMMAFSVNNWMPQELSVQMSGLTDDPDEWMDQLVDQATERLPFMLEITGLKRAEAWLGKDSPEYQLLLQKVMQSQQQSQAEPPGGAPGVPSGGGGGMTPPSPRDTGGRGGMGGNPFQAGMSENMQQHTSGRPRGRQQRQPLGAPSGAGLGAPPGSSENPF